jgi:hypothetical protein
MPILLAQEQRKAQQNQHSRNNDADIENIEECHDACES